MAIFLVNREKLVLDPTYLGLLYARLDECTHNILCSVGRYDIVPTNNLDLEVRRDRTQAHRVSSGGDGGSYCRRGEKS